MKTNHFFYITIIFGILITYGFCIYFSIEHQNGSEWLSNLLWFIVYSPFTQSPWLLMLKITKHIKNKGIWLGIINLISSTLGAWMYYENLIRAQDPSRVLTFAMVPVFQLIIVMIVWGFMELANRLGGVQK